jgi:hypothetical protein
MSKESYPSDALKCLMRKNKNFIAEFFYTGKRKIASLIKYHSIFHLRSKKQ